MRLVYSRRALADLEAILAYIQTDSSVAARRVIERVLEALRRLERFPLSGRPGIKPGTRELSIPGLPYLAIYRIIEVSGENVVQVVAIYHTARNRRPSDY